eukprot:6129463-Pyramimonas_sp.AAC.2
MVRAIGWMLRAAWWTLRAIGWMLRATWWTLPAPSPRWRCPALRWPRPGSGSWDPAPARARWPPAASAPRSAGSHPRPRMRVGLARRRLDLFVRRRGHAVRAAPEANVLADRAREQPRLLAHVPATS